MQKGREKSRLEKAAELGRNSPAAVYYCLLLAKAALTENHKAHIEGVKISLNY